MPKTLYMSSWQRRNADFVASHPIPAVLILGAGGGMVFWLGFGIENHALNLTLFVIAMAVGLLLFGPIFVVVVRRRGRPN